MISETELDLYAKRNRLSKPVVQYIRAALESPSRRVGSGRSQISVRYASPRWRVTISAESYTGEFAFVLTRERDPTCLACIDQPPPRKVWRQLPGGRRHASLWTPDFLSLEAHGPELVEYKPTRQIEQLDRKRPGFWVHDGERWTCPAFENAAAELGVAFRLVTEKDLNYCLCDNSKMIADYLIREAAPPDESTATDVIELVRKKVGIELSQLIPPIGRFSADDIFGLIAAGRLYVDLTRAPLRYPTRCLVFVDKSTAAIFST